MENTKALKSLKLGVEPVGKLIFKMSAPAMISMLVQALYNIVDSIFVSHSSQAALTALSLAFPMQLLVLAFSLGFGVGTNSVIARKLGEGNYSEAGKTAQNGLFLSLCVGAFFAIIGYFISVWFIGLYTNDPAIHRMGYEYLSICVCCTLFPCVEIMLNRILQATGNMLIPMTCQLAGAITNIILDPLLIFGLIGIAPMGVKGAAIATVIGQAVAMSVAIGYIIFNRKKLDIRIFFYKFRPQWLYIRQILRVGLPALVMNAIGSVMYLIANFMLMSFSDTAINVFGVYFKLQSMIFMPCFGLNQGVMPILGYNYGANFKPRFIRAFRISLATSTVIMLIGLVFFQALPSHIMSLFNASGDMMTLGVEALRICSVSFIPASVSVILIAMFTAIGHGMKAMLISAMRQLAFLLPIAYLLSRYIGITGFWAAFPIAELLVALIFLPVAITTVRKIFARKDAEQALRLADSALEATAN